MNRYLLDIDWVQLYGASNVDEIVTIFISTVLDAAKLFIPYESKEIQKSSHPWLNDRCKDLALAKQAAFGTSIFAEKKDACSKGLFEEYQNNPHEATYTRT